MTLIPIETLKVWEERAFRADSERFLNWSEAAEEYQALKVEFKDKPTDGVFRQFYQEVATANRCSVAHAEERVSQFVRFGEKYVKHCLLKGLSFDHLKKAPVYRPNDPKSLLELAIHGDENGNPLTVDLMVGLALSELPDRGVGVKVLDFAKRFVKQVRGILKLDHGQSEKMQGEIREAVEEIVSRYQEG